MYEQIFTNSHTLSYGQIMSTEIYKNCQVLAQHTYLKCESQDPPNIYSHVYKITSILRVFISLSRDVIYLSTLSQYYCLNFTDQIQSKVGG